MRVNQPGLLLRHMRAQDWLREFLDVQLVHVLRDYSQAADHLATLAIQKQASEEVDPSKYGDLEVLSQLHKVVADQSEKTVGPRAGVNAVQTRRARALAEEAGSPDGDPDPPGREEEGISPPPEGVTETLPPMPGSSVQDERKARIQRSQDEEVWIWEIKCFLRGEVDEFDLAKVKKVAKVADLFALDADGLLFCIPASREGEESERRGARMVLPTSLHEETLRHFHCSISGGIKNVPPSLAAVLLERDVRGCTAFCAGMSGL